MDAVGGQPVRTTATCWPVLWLTVGLASPEPQQEIRREGRQRSCQGGHVPRQNVTVFLKPHDFLLPTCITPSPFFRLILAQVLQYLLGISIHTDRPLFCSPFMKHTPPSQGITPIRGCHYVLPGALTYKINIRTNNVIK